MTPVELIALSGCSRPEAGRACSICIGAAEAHVHAVESAGLVVVSAELLDALTDPDECWFDHHGGCQAHGYLSLEPGERCPQAEARELLAALPERTENV
ncbi:hypothetical protein ACGFNP_25390 [Nonomuraea sp. NPDC049269]|uniref:hypothetical protein n=1 Tax=Nonomuraea sp. NPDC049269 TaxID=3364349 RepID=UPI00371B13A6